MTCHHDRMSLTPHAPAFAVEKRISTSERWDRSPYSLHEDYLWGPEAWHEGEGIDFLMPYWMARYYGVL